MSRPIDVLCAGVVVADHLCAPIERLPSAGEIITAPQMLLTLGGGAANTAVDLAKMRVSAAAAGRVGDDDLGRIVAELLRRTEVDVSALQFDAKEATGQSLIINVRGDDRRFITSFGANANFKAADIPLERVQHCRVFHLGGYLVLPAMQQDAVADLFAAARQAGVKTVLDIAVSGPGDYLPQLERLLPHVDVFLPNQDEAAQICGDGDVLQQAEQFCHLGAETTIITCGGGGCVLVNDQVRLRAGTYPAEYVDGTGCGDAFDAGYIFGLLHGMSTEDCLRYATALGASCVRAVGTTPGVFTRDECEAFLRQHTLRIESL